jgi:hypothetical protein
MLIHARRRALRESQAKKEELGRTVEVERTPPTRRIGSRTRARRVGGSRLVELAIGRSRCATSESNGMGCPGSKAKRRFDEIARGVPAPFGVGVS